MASEERIVNSSACFVPYLPKQKAFLSTQVRQSHSYGMYVSHSCSSQILPNLASVIPAPIISTNGQCGKLNNVCNGNNDYLFAILQPFSPPALKASLACSKPGDAG